MAAKLNILVCDMETAMQESAKHVSPFIWFTPRADYHGSVWKSQGRADYRQRD